MTIRSLDKFGKCRDYYPASATGGTTAQTLRNVADEIQNAIVTTAKFAQGIKPIEVETTV